MSENAITRSMRDTSDDELLAITSGVAMGYSDQARAIAEAVLRERGVELPADLEESRERGAAAEAEANRRRDDLDAERGRSVGRKVGIRLLVLAGMAFLFSIVKHSAIPFGAVIITIAAYILIVRTNDDAPKTPPDNAGP